MSLLDVFIAAVKKTTPPRQESVSIVVLTESEYDELASPDSNTLYFVVEDET